MLSPSERFAATVERMLDVSLLALVVVSFAALGATGKLDFLSVAAVTLAILLRAVFFLRNIGRQMSVATTTKLTVAYAFVYAIDFFALSRSFISATVHLVLFLLVVKLFSVQRDRDRLYLAVISFLMLLAAAILTIDAFYLGAFILFSMIAIVAFIIMEMRRSMQSGATIAVPQGNAPLGRLISLTAGVLIVGILVLTPLLFFALPRVSAGRLSQFAQQNAYTTGFGDEVTLGQIGQIQQSDAVVMRAQFDRTPPADLKWHGVTLKHFDGRRWFNRRQEEGAVVLPGSLDNTATTNHPTAQWILNGVAEASAAPIKSSGKKLFVSYRANLEPVGANLFFYPSRLVSIRGTASRNYILTYNAVLTYRDTGVFVVRSYSGLSVIDTAPPGEDTHEPYSPQLIPYLELPAVDPRVKALAEQITLNAASPSAKALAIETYLRTQFGYTLEMVRSDDPIPFFLFERKQGHCEYFASAMAVMLRTIGIPSRIVNGFRNGEHSDITGSYLIRGKDAHSWVEAFIPGHGWVEFDPTPAGDPVPQTFWSRAGLYLDAAREFWGDWVINYDFSHQNVLAELTTNTARGKALSLWKSLDKMYWQTIHRLQRALRILQEPSARQPQGWIWKLLLAIFLPTIAFLWFRARRRRLNLHRSMPENFASVWFDRLLRKTAKRGWQKPPAQTAAHWANTIPDHGIRPTITAFVKEYENARFGASRGSADKLPALYEEIDATLK
jgi:protein-glutamine gamma-glutamyltransferase